ncbi:hypothetical protein [Streptomyces sp. NPDC002403]
MLDKGALDRHRELAYVLTCRPTNSWKRLDCAASWTIASTLERHVRAALKDH